MAKERNIPQTVIQTEADSPKWWIIGGLVVVAGIGGAVWYIDRKIKQEKKSRVEENALTEGSTENYAKRLALQLGKKWYMLEFPDKEEIFSVLRQIGDQKAYDQVAKDYFRLTGRTLNQDLAERLDDKEFRTAIVLYNSKVQDQSAAGAGQQLQAIKVEAAEYVADEIWAAVEGLGTDEQRVYKAFLALSTKRMYEELLRIFKQKYKIDLWDRLGEELYLISGGSLSMGGGFWQTPINRFKEIVSKLK